MRYSGEEGVLVKCITPSASRYMSISAETGAPASNDRITSAHSPPRMFFFASVGLNPHQTVSDNSESTLKSRPISKYYIFFLDKLKSPVHIDRLKRIPPKVSAVSAGDLNTFNRLERTVTTTAEAAIAVSGESSLRILRGPAVPSSLGNHFRRDPEGRLPWRLAARPFFAELPDIAW